MVSNLQKFVLSHLLYTILFLFIAGFSQGQEKTYTYADLDIKVLILGKSGDQITLSKKDLINWKSIRTNTSDTEIIEFVMSAEANGSLVELSSKNTYLTKEMKEFINSSAKIDTLNVDKIKVKMPDGTVRQLPPINVTINYR